MHIKLLTPEEFDLIKQIFEKHQNLSLQNKGYEEIALSKLSEEDQAAHQKVTAILQKSVTGFNRFQNFRLSKDGEIEIRLQYNYDADNKDHRGPTFTGVGYILLKELLNGFN